MLNTSKNIKKSQNIFVINKSLSVMMGFVMLNLEKKKAPRISTPGRFNLGMYDLLHSYIPKKFLDLIIQASVLKVHRSFISIILSVEPGRYYA